MGSIGGKVYTIAKPSSMTELSAMAIRDFKSAFFPKSIQPKINSGTFNAIISIPTGSTGTRALMIWAIPVMPVSYTHLTLPTILLV